MENRSWLWRKKSSEKSPGETESSGSVSSHSERFSDDQVIFSTAHSDLLRLKSLIIKNPYVAQMFQLLLVSGFLRHIYFC